MALLIFFAIHWYLSLFFQSFFHHRYSAHGQFSMSRGWEKFFYWCCFITQGSSYISAYSYGIMHRLHHMHTDTGSDPHSPDNYTGFFSLMLNTRNNYFAIYSGKTEVDKKMTKDLPQWVAFDKIAHHPLSRLFWISIYILIYFWLATSWWMFLFLPLTIIMGTLQGAVVNYWAHRLGYVNFKTGDQSKNIVPLDLFFWGEGYHNNHHKNPGRAKNAYRWFEFDFGYLVLRIFNALKIIRMKKNPPYVKYIAP